MQWHQVNTDGFGSPETIGILSLGTFHGQLYAGTLGSSQGAQLWRTSIGNHWTRVVSGGFGNTNAEGEGIGYLLEFNNQLYASTGGPASGEIWRSRDGLEWTRVVSQGFGDPSNIEVFRLAVFNNALYASTSVFTTSHSAEIWSTPTGNAGDWTRVVDGFGDVNNTMIPAFQSFNGYLYAGTFNPTTGGELWRTNNGTSWTQVNTDGFGSVHSVDVSALAAYYGYLYAAADSAVDSAGAQIWRCRTCDGSDWVAVVTTNQHLPQAVMTAFEVFNNHLYYIAGSGVDSGIQVWRTPNGTDWEIVASGGFGDNGNWGTYWDNAATVFDGCLYIGTINDTTGAEVWMSTCYYYWPFVPL